MSSNLFIATGFGGNGTTYGTLGAWIVADQILGRENPYTKLYSPSRVNARASAKRFVSENVEGGTNKPLRFGTIEREMNDEKPRHKGSDLVHWSTNAQSEGMIDLFKRLLLQIRGLDDVTRKQLEGLLEGGPKA